MKANIAGNFILIGIILVGVLTFRFFVGYQDLGKVETITFIEDIYTMENALKLANQYASTSLRYSTYQACYDNLQQPAGLSSKEEFIQKLKEDIKNNLEIYTKNGYIFLKKYKIDFPNYNISLNESKNGLNVIAFTSKNLIINKKDKNRQVRLEKKTKLNESIQTNCISIFDSGIQYAAAIKNLLLEKIKNITESYPKKITGKFSKKLFSSETLSDFNLICSKILEREAKMNDAAIILKIENAIKDSIKDITESLNIKKNDLVNINFAKGPKADIKITPEITLMGENITGTCSFEYNIDTELSVNISNKDSHKFPIYDGEKLVFSELKLNFLLEIRYK